MTNTSPTRFVVREIRGRFVPTFLDEARAWLHHESSIAFQLNGPNGRRNRVPLALDGGFHVPHLPPGRYCFHTSSDSFQGHDGISIIDPSAAESFMNIPVELGACGAAGQVFRLPLFHEPEHST